MTVRGGGFPTGPLALMPIGRMGPPLRSFAADAHDCIVVWSLDLPNTRLWRDYTALESGLPSDRHPDRTKRRHCGSRPFKARPEKRGANEARVGKKKRTFTSDKEKGDGKRCATLLKLLD